MTSTLASHRLVVTGGSGFIGSAFIRHATSMGARVTAIVRPGADLWRLDTVRDRLHILHAASADYRTLDAANCSGPDAFVHCAASGVNQRFDDVTEMVATNVSGTLAALQLATRMNAGRFILLGTSGEYGPGLRLTEEASLRPTSEYGATRASATLLAKAYDARRGLPVCVLRPFSVFGPYEAAYRLVPHCVLRALAGNLIEISAGSQTRDFVFVDDVVDAMARAVTGSADSQIVNICTGVSTPVRELAGMVARIVASGSTVVAGAVGDIPGEMWRTSGDPARAASVLGWKPTRSLEEGLLATVQWFRMYGLIYAQHYPPR